MREEDPQVRRGMIGSAGRFEKEVVWKAILPALSGCQRLHQSMSFLLPMSARMPILRIVTAADLSAHQA
jgi:hypothetical protein